MNQPHIVDNNQDEKAGLLGGNIDQHETHRKRAFFFKTITITFVVFCWLAFHHIAARFGHTQRGDAGHHGHAKLMDFEDIIPSEKLQWHPCRGSFLCARLTVPMDYHRPLNTSSEHPRVHIALLMAPGKHDGPKKFSTSPLLINPGGPGGPGTFIVQMLGDHIQSIVGEDQDVIGFDPRGIGATTPRADCFSYPLNGTVIESSSDYEQEDYLKGHFHRMAWLNSGREIGLVNSSSVALSKIDIRARTIAKLCQEKDSLSGKDSIYKYIHTPSVARDMLSIIDAWDDWTDSLHHHGCRTTPPAQEEETDNTTEEKYSLDTKGKLVYWGFSYGTLLGATFASMFPDRVGRVALDGVVDADLYVAPVWTDSLRDTDTIFNSLPKYCHEAKEDCALYREGDGVSDVEDRLQGALSNLKENPLTIIDYSKAPLVITINDIKSIIFSILYAPVQGFAVIAEIINRIILGDDTLLGQVFGIGGPEGFCVHYFPGWMYPTEAQAAIMCSDKRYPLNETIPNLEKRFEKLSKVSSFSDVWMSLMIGCDGWGIEAIDPPMKWDDHPAQKLKPINTSFPLLFLSNTADPVTPLYAGVKMALKFVDAGLVEQNSMGHCTLAAASRCTLGKIRKYFKDGKVPPHPVKGESGDDHVDGNWDRCEADEWPFHGYEASEWIGAAEDSNEALVEAKSMAAMKEMQAVFKDFKFFGAGHGPGKYKIA